MIVPLTIAWKLTLAVALAAAIVASACARAPRRPADPADLRRLVGCALALYGAGAVASFTHHPALAAIVYGAGIIVAALAAWLSRGRDQEDPPDGGEPVNQPPPPRPDGVSHIDWTRFEREFRDYARHQRRPPRVRETHRRSPAAAAAAHRSDIVSIDR